MKELMLSLVVWMGANSEYQIESHLPQIKQLTMYEMCRTYGIQDIERCDSSRLKAFYDREGTIYLSTMDNGSTVSSRTTASDTLN